MKIVKLLADGTSVASKPKSGLATELGPKVSALFPSIPMIISTLIALVLIIVILWFLLHKPLRKSIKERQDYIQHNIDQAKATNDLSQQKLKEANARLAKAYEEANNLIKDAKVHGESVIASYTQKAKAESKRIRQKAELDIKNQKAALLEQSKNNIAKAAIEISRQIIKKEVSKESQEEIIDKFLKEA